jgi:hypothetical protein
VTLIPDDGFSAAFAGVVVLTTALMGCGIAGS